jgi:4-oxalocrotonate tautomerase
MYVLTTADFVRRWASLRNPGDLMPNITVELLSGRTLDQRREFAEAVTAAAVDILKARRASVRIRFDEIERQDVANGGTLESDNV